MSKERTGCEARQYSDQMSCSRCALVWDMNDPEPPECPRMTRFGENAKRMVNEMRERSEACRNVPEPRSDLRMYEQAANWSAMVLVRLDVPAHMKPEGERFDIGRYSHSLEHWQVPGHSAPKVLEWWPLPPVGSGVKPK